MTLKLILFLCLFSCLFANDPNTIDPNMVEPATFEIPFVGQWLNTSVRTVTKFPDLTPVQADPGIQWSFVNGKWIPSHGKQQMVLSGDGHLTQAEMNFEDSDKKYRVAITGEFKIEVTHTGIVSCDISGDGRVDLIDYAVWANDLTWPPEPNEPPANLELSVWNKIPSVIYHTEDCRYVTGDYEPMFIIDALNAGMRGCKVCNPMFTEKNDEIN